MSEPSKTRFRHIHFTRQEAIDVCPGLVDGWFIRNNRTSALMGSLEWYPRWSQWVAVFSEDFIWSTDCLADLREFIASLPAAQPSAQVVGNNSITGGR